MMQEEQHDGSGSSNGNTPSCVQARNLNQDRLIMGVKAVYEKYCLWEQVGACNRKGTAEVGLYVGGLGIKTEGCVVRCCLCMPHLCHCCR